MVAPRPELPPKLNIMSLIAGCLAAWAIGCFLVHGPVILAYIGLQIATAGVFSWSMNRVEKNAQQRRSAAKKPAADRDAQATAKGNSEEPVRSTTASGV